jgi:hypothetical protein
MGIGGQAKQLLHQGMKKQPHTNTHKITSTQTVVKANRIKLGIDVHGCQIEKLAWRGALRKDF